MSPKNIPYNPEAQKVLKAFADLLAPRYVEIEVEEKAAKEESDEEEESEFSSKGKPGLDMSQSRYRLENPAFPTVGDLAKKVDMPIQKVKKLLKAINTDNFRDSLKLLTPNVLVGIYHSSQSGNAQAAKLWLQYVENWEEKSKTSNELSGSLVIKVEREIVE